MIGKTVSHYKILDKLGEGGMGVVYKAHDTKLDRTVALKFLPQHVGVDTEEKQRFINEAKAASALDHNNICNIHSIEETDDKQIFIVMAHYEGMSLHEKIKQGPLPLIDITKYAIQISEGLRKAHERGIVHRDLKPANIFITTDEQVKIIDFGLAKATVQTMLTKTGTMLGTVPYMSPEQAQGNKVDHRTDIWSLGIVMYEMVTGQRPFKSEYETALVYSIINEDPDPVTGLRSGVPMDLEKIINKCLEKDPYDRYQHADEIIVDLRKVKKEISGEVRSRVSVSGETEAVPVKQPVAPERSVTESRRKLLRYGIPVLIVLGMLLYMVIPEKTEVGTVNRSIAVLPLENLSPDPDDAFFAAGMHEDIIIQLSRIGALQVIARSSVLGYAPGERNIRNISNELGVHSILEGSVRRIADRVRVSVSLTDVQTNRTLWADSFDRDLTDIFVIQSEIAREIAQALETSLTEVEHIHITDRPTEITEAYEYYLRARAHFNKPGARMEDYSLAENLLKDAIERDPGFAHAYALLSRMYSSSHWFGYDVSPALLENSRHYAERALQLRPNLPEAHIAMGYYHYHGHRNYDKALEHFNSARRSQPNNAEIIAAIGFVERRLGRFDDSIRNVNQAISLDPLNLNAIYNNAMSYMLTGRYEAANDALEKIISLAPDFYSVRIMQALNVILWKGDVEWVRTYMHQHAHIKEYVPGDWMRLQFIIRDFNGIINTVNEVPQDTYEGQLYIYSPSYFIGLAYDYLQDREKAQQNYKAALSHFQELQSIYRDDPRYLLYLGKIYAGLGIPEEAIANGKEAVEMIAQLGDDFNLPTYKWELASIYAQMHRSNEAVELLNDILSVPSFHSVTRLKIDPSWDPIRETPEFQNLLRDFEETVS